MAVEFAAWRAGWRLAVFVALVAGVPYALGRLAPAHTAVGGAGLLTPGAVFAGEALGLIWVALVTALLARLEEQPAGRFGLPRRTAFGRRFWQGALWGALALSALLLLMAAGGGVRFDHPRLPLGLGLRYGLAWAAVFLTVALFEEYRYRGYALVTLDAGLGFWPAAVLLSTAFGASHLRNPGETAFGALSAGLLGLFFCYTFRRTGSLWFAVGMHASWDFCQSFVYGVPDSGLVSQGRLLQPRFHGPDWLTGGSVGPEGSLAVLLVVAALFMLFARLRAVPD